MYEFQHKLNIKVDNEVEEFIIKSTKGCSNEETVYINTKKIEEAIKTNSNTNLWE